MKWGMGVWGGTPSAISFLWEASYAGAQSPGTGHHLSHRMADITREQGERGGYVI